MECPRCNSTETRRITKYLSTIMGHPDRVIRTRYCINCHQHFDTIEESISMIDLTMTDHVRNVKDINNNTLTKRWRVTKSGAEYQTIERIFQFYVWNPKDLTNEAKEYV